MAEQLTKQQAQAVYDRGGKLLVSAAAGSGKTKVLVDRLLSYLTDETNPANMDEFLIITYTKAAAAELRGKIAAKLTERIAFEPENRHLQQQMQRLYLTQISTVHAFCTELLREHAYRLDLSADFRVADENEIKEIRDRIVTKVLDDAYETIDQNEDFRAFVDTQGLGRSDALVPEILLKVYDSSRCHLNPRAWLDDCLKNAAIEGVSDPLQTIWGAYLVQDLTKYLDMQIRAMEECAVAASKVPEWDKGAKLLSDTVFQLKRLSESRSWDEIHRNSSINYGRLTLSAKGGDPETAERIKAVREACKKGLAKKLAAFSDPSAQVLEDLKQSQGAVRGLIGLVNAFDQAFESYKRSRRILDFADLEHKTLDLLWGKNRTGITGVALETGRRFREIMVDEYQDSNAVQDSIFDALTRQKQNLFLVGDVKQSIYQFRLADPGIFLEKYRTYDPVEEGKPGRGRKVMLSSNFRSAGAVIEGVNHVFRSCMSEAVGGLDYGSEEALNEGIPHIDNTEPEVELHVVEVTEDTYGEEAALVAQRITELLDGQHMIRQGNSLRPIQAEDIVILLRSPGSAAAVFQRALEQRGIRCFSGGTGDLLQTQEIGTLRAILQTISNPRQDIPLIAALCSPVFGFTADDLAYIRAGKKKYTFYDALCKSDHPKVPGFLTLLNRLRHHARLGTLTELIEQIFVLTSMDSIYGCMDAGGARRNNLQLFFQYAVNFENGNHRDLEQFLDHLQAMEEKGLQASGDQTAIGAVTIMSIHKSKGLEFPVVFLSNLSRSFNRESLRAQVLCHNDLGLGLSCVDRKNRIRYPSISKRAIAVKSVSESLSEELRVLYVAMTRPKDRLIMTYATKNPEAELSDIVQRMDMGDRELLTGSATCPGEWVLMAALRRTEAGALFAVGGRPVATQVSDRPWNIRISKAEITSTSPKKELNEAVFAEKDVLERISRGLAFRYEHTSATQAPSKQTATQRKGRIKDQEVSENTKEPVHHRIWRKPTFLPGGAESTAYGNATHAALQHLRYEACTDPSSVKREIDRMVAKKLITEEQGQLVDCVKIATLFDSPMGKKLRSAGNILREFKFSILDDASAYADGLEGERVLLQGVVDCAVLDHDGITVIDFKTDRVDTKGLKALADHYAPQVDAYALSLSRIFEMPVKQKLLYFFQLDTFVEL